jgi:hypothetical protein
VPADSRYTVRTVSAPGAHTIWTERARVEGVTGAASADGAAPVALPRRWLGAPATGGLMLPAAMPTASQLYAPRGVWLDDQLLAVADTGNHRVLLWHDPDPESHTPADVVLGQPDFFTEGPQAGGRGPRRGLRLPTGVLVHDGRLVVADSWNHRILVWNSVPERSDLEPDVVIGQPDPEAVTENRGQGCGPLGFYWPFGIAVVGDRFYVADTGNRRILGWEGVPEPDEKPAVVLGQPDGFQRDENRGEIGPASFRWAHDISGTADRLLVADAGNHRVLGWRPHPDSDGDADLVLGQRDFLTGSEFPYQPQTPSGLRFPYALSCDAPHQRLAVADTANNRVLLWDILPETDASPADHVLGQPTFAANGENRWDAVGPDTLCWPYGLCLADRRLAIADSGNNRVVIWELQR